MMGKQATGTPGRPGAIVDPIVAQIVARIVARIVVRAIEETSDPGRPLRRPLP